MKNLDWKIVMFAAVVLMLSGFGISVWGVNLDDHGVIWAGLITMTVVCVSWWFWVMFVIKTMISCNEKTTHGVNAIRTDLKDLKNLFAQAEIKD